MTAIAETQQRRLRRRGEPLNRKELSMWWRKVSTGVTLAIMVFGASEGRIAGFVRSSFPSDIAEREALKRCSVSDSTFSRFSERDRAACYQQNHVAKARTGSEAIVVVDTAGPRWGGPNDSN